MIFDKHFLILKRFYLIITIALTSKWINIVLKKRYGTIIKNYSIINKIRKKERKKDKNSIANLSQL